jgi:regulator of PEP synthase PpsR (kinase-PPPase family)
VSESTGISAETVGHGLLSQFDGIDFKTVYMPFINASVPIEEISSRIVKNL